MTLAYVFWHRPRADVDRDGYEDALRAFHATLDLPSATFRLDALPFDERDGYEDWYLVEDWAALGVLNDAAVDAVHRPAHDVPARAVSEGWGGVYRLIRGEAEPPPLTQWGWKRPGEPLEDYLASQDAAAVWMRQMVLGPAPEFCLVAGDGSGRVAL